MSSSCRHCCRHLVLHRDASLFFLPKFVFSRLNSSVTQAATGVHQGHHPVDRMNICCWTPSPPFLLQPRKGKDDSWNTMYCNLLSAACKDAVQIQWIFKFFKILPGKLSLRSLQIVLHVCKTFYMYVKYVQTLIWRCTWWLSLTPNRKCTICIIWIQTRLMQPLSGHISLAKHVLKLTKFATQASRLVELFTSIVTQLSSATYKNKSSDQRSLCSTLQRAYWGVVLWYVILAKALTARVGWRWQAQPLKCY